MPRAKTPPLQQAAKDGDLEKVRAVMQKKWWRAAPDIDFGDDWGCTALHYAAEGENRELVEWLLEKGADVGAVNRFGHQPLHNAARHGRTEMVATLLECGAALDAPAGGDGSALHLACQRARLETTRLLLECGADRTIRNKDGQTAEELARTTRNEALIALFE